MAIPRNIKIISIVSVCLVIFVSFSFVAWRKIENTRRKEAERKAKLDALHHLKEFSANAYRKYNERMQQAEEEFEQKIKIVEQKLAKAKEEIGPTVDECTSDNIISIMATSVDGDFNKKIQDTIDKNLISKLQEMLYSADEAVQSLQLRMDENWQKFHADMAMFTDSPNEEERARRQNWMEKIVPETHESVQNAIQNTISLEKVLRPAVYLYSERAGIFVIYRIAGKAAASLAKKMASRSAAAGIAAVVDGPLPIGDIIGGGVMAYTVYDTYNELKELKSNLKKDIHKAITGSVTSYEKDLKTMLRDSQSQITKAARDKMKQRMKEIDDRIQRISEELQIQN